MVLFCVSACLTFAPVAGSGLAGRSPQSRGKSPGSGSSWPLDVSIVYELSSGPASTNSLNYGGASSWSGSTNSHDVEKDKNLSSWSDIQGYHDDRLSGCETEHSGGVKKQAGMAVEAECCTADRGQKQTRQAGMAVECCTADRGQKQAYQAGQGWL